MLRVPDRELIYEKVLLVCLIHHLCLWGCHHVQPNASTAPMSTTKMDDSQDDYVKNSIKIEGHMDDVGRMAGHRTYVQIVKTFQAWQLETLSPSVIMSKLWAQVMRTFLHLIFGEVWGREIRKNMFMNHVYKNRMLNMEKSYNITF